MALKLEDLKVGEKYLDSDMEIVEIKYIGEELVFLKKNKGLELERCSNIDFILKKYSLMPKEKTKIKLTTFSTRTGRCIEMINGSEEYELYLRKGHSVFSEREIEVME